MIFSWLHPVPWTVDPTDLPDRYDWSPVPLTECAQCGADTGSDAMAYCSEKCQINWRAQNRKEVWRDGSRGVPQGTAG